MDQQKIVVNLGGHVYTFTWAEEATWDAEELLSIHEYNIMAELTTFPMLQNRVGQMLQAAEDNFRHTKMQFEIESANIYKKVKAALITDNGKTTEKEVEAEVTLSPDSKTAKIKLLNAQRDLGVITEFYWAVKDKGKKLEVISAKLKPEEFEKEMIEETVNQMTITKQKDFFPKPTPNIR